jgi:hypothetical protein
LFVIRVVLLLIVMFYVLFVCKCVLPPGVNPIAVDKYIDINKDKKCYCYRDSRRYSPSSEHNCSKKIRAFASRWRSLQHPQTQISFEMAATQFIHKVDCIVENEAEAKIVIDIQYSSLYSVSFFTKNALSLKFIFMVLQAIFRQSNFVYVCAVAIFKKTGKRNLT